MLYEVITDAIANQARPSVTETPEDDLYAHDEQHFIYPYRLFGQDIDKARITSYNVCYTKLLRLMAHAGQ